MRTYRLTVESVVNGNAWLGVPTLTPISTPTTPLADVKIQFRRYIGDRKVGDTLSVSNGKILILSAASWTISIPEVILNLRPGDWVFDILYTGENGMPFTLVDGILTVFPSVTK